ncbi:hypothetical protein [Demequina lignilytica]|uniref:PknH-like extracellular domain-containing protein n=1 Tax=Demequina lignilytica TaxID=3051663 RepID=A0AB35MJ63_9MICO|nr:hypothetical protein [Demequina sp. SYSU T0a273]MDN4483766.1 hypothetical protein [Demequina sp. SYSU T0a273]
MTDDLTTMMLDSLDKEARRFERAHPGSETTLYEKAIVPRRRIRRAAEAGVALAVVAAVAVGAHALVQPRATVEPAESASATAVPLDEREWDLPGTLDPLAEVTPLTTYWGIDDAWVPGCVVLDSLARLEGLDQLGGAPQPLGAIDDGNGGTHGIATRTFASPDEALDYLRQAAVAAEGCRTDGESVGLAVDVAEVGIQSVAGEGLRVGFTHPSDTFGSGYSIWIHVDGAEAFAVAAEAPADRLAAQIITAWFTAEG